MFWIKGNKQFILYTGKAKKTLHGTDSSYRCFQPADRHSSETSTDTNQNSTTTCSGRTPKKVLQSSKCIKSPDGNFKDKAATILPARRKWERFLLDIASSRRNRLFQLQFVICLLHTPLCVHAFDKSLSECKPTICRLPLAAISARLRNVICKPELQERFHAIL